MARTGVHILLLFAVLAIAALVDDVESKKDRGGALDAAKGKKPKVERNSTSPTQRQAKREQLAGCINMAASNAGAKRRNGDTPQKVRDRKNKIIEAAGSCTDAATDACTPADDGAGDTNGGSSGSGNRRRLQELLAVDPRVLSPEEARQHMRQLLQVADDDTFVQTAIDTDDDDDAAFVDGVREQLSDQEVQDFCDLQNEPTVQAFVQAYSDPDASPQRLTAQAAKGGFASSGAFTLPRLLYDSSGRRIPLREHFERMRAEQATAKAQGVKAMSQPSDCRVGTGVRAMKDSTLTRVTCDTGTNLGNAIIPAYPPDDTKGFSTTVKRLPSGYLLGTQGTPGENGLKYKEYSSADNWGEQWDAASIVEISINTVEMVFTAFATACDTAGKQLFWVGFGAGTKISPGGLICTPMGFVFQLTLLAFRLARVEVDQIFLAAASTHDAVLQAVEVEAIGENVNTLTHNGILTHHLVGKTTEATQTAVSDAADQTLKLIQALADQVDALEQKLSELIARRSCDIQNSVTNMHNTINHVQRLHLVPEGLRPGYKNKKEPSLLGCSLTPPATCTQANVTSRVGATGECNAGFPGSLALSAMPVAGNDVQSLMADSPLNEKAAAQGRTRRISP